MAASPYTIETIEYLLGEVLRDLGVEDDPLLQVTRFELADLLAEHKHKNLDELRNVLAAFVRDRLGADVSDDEA